MAVVFQRRLAIPVWVTAFLAVALTVPTSATLLLMPAITVFALAFLGIAATVFLMPELSPWSRPAVALARRDSVRHGYGPGDQARW